MKKLYLLEWWQIGNPDKVSVTEVKDYSAFKYRGQSCYRFIEAVSPLQALRKAGLSYYRAKKILQE